MSQEALVKLIDRAWRDGALWTRLMEWPDEVLAEYHLSDDEVEALRAGNLTFLQELGVDEGRLDRVRELAT